MKEAGARRFSHRVQEKGSPLSLDWRDPISGSHPAERSKAYNTPRN